ncbi:MAG: DUF1934 domain-containing protein [Clostridia bacterium]|jgi:uncharacterized beta-barrel protein YwiB (DUF1934 family)|nr:DUF1934 domain-containing protein [Clostridia bacterium]
MKEAYITVRDRHFLSPYSKDDEFGELKTGCQIGVDGNSIVIKYKESVDEVNDCQTCLMIKQGVVSMVRVGRFHTNMIFENKKRHICCYETPFGSLMVGIYTNAMFIDFSENGGEVNLAYTIDVSGDLVSENELKILVEIKEDSDVVTG